VKVISGGQTGADRAGLDAASALGLPTGGHAPAGFWTESGADPSLERLGLAASGSPEFRTERNVLDADATVIFAPGVLAAGSELTRTLARRHRKPAIVLDPWAPDAARLLAEFLRAQTPTVLNVAGDRESQSPGIYRRVRELLTTVLASVALDGQHPPP
jgi:Circularly permutated YpsA SLOG family